MKVLRDYYLIVGLALLITVVLMVACGCGAITRYVGDAIKSDAIERIGSVEQKVEVLADKMEAVAEEVEKRVTEAVKTPIVGIIITLILGAGLAVVCAFKFPSLVDEVIIGTVALAGILLVWAYRAPILWTAAAAAAGLLGWKLLRKYVLPKVTNVEPVPGTPPVAPASEDKK